MAPPSPGTPLSPAPPLLWKPPPMRLGGGVPAQVLWGEDPKAHLNDVFLMARDLSVPSPFRPGYEAYATGSDSGWGGSPAPDSNHGQGAWGLPPPGASDRDTLGGAGHPSGGRDHHGTE